MTTFDRFDPFDPLEQRITAAIDDLAATRRPDYLDDILGVTAATPQRPRWTFPGRWLPVDTAGAAAPQRNWARALVVILLLALIAAATLVIAAGSRPKLAPVGPARNGAIVYEQNGDLFVRDSLGVDGRPLVASAASEAGPYVSPDGNTVVYVQTAPAGDTLYAVDIDGSHPRQLLPYAIEPGWSQLSWSPDSAHLLVSGVFGGGTQRLYAVATDGSGARELSWPNLVPWEATWSPVEPGVFLLRAQRTTGVRAQGLYLGNVTDQVLRPLGLPGQSAFGERYTLSGAAWSPDGKTIAYNSIGTEASTFITNFRIHLVNADGTNDRALPGPVDPTIQEAWPVFSPDGTQLLVQRFILPSTGTTNDGSGWIAVMPIDGSAVAHDIGMRLDGTSTPDTVKAWSPDGTSVLQWVDATRKAYVVDPVSGAATEVPWAGGMPDWQRRAR